MAFETLCKRPLQVSVKFITQFATDTKIFLYMHMYIYDVIYLMAIECLLLFKLTTNNLWR